jgi:hypothetical protein
VLKTINEKIGMERAIRDVTSLARHCNALQARNFRRKLKLESFLNSANQKRL